MIGVAVQPNERAIVAEFFELFKTPWEFLSERQDDTTLCYAPRMSFCFEGSAVGVDSWRRSDTV